MKAMSSKDEKGIETYTDTVADLLLRLLNIDLHKNVNSRTTLIRRF